MKRLRANFVSKYPDVAVDEAEDDAGDGVNGDKKQKIIFEASLRNGIFTFKDIVTTYNIVKKGCPSN